MFFKIWFLYQRFLSHFPSREGKENLQKLMDYIAHNPISFKVEKIEEDDEKYFMATTKLENGYITTTGETWEELHYNIKDAIFTAFDVPAFYCDFKKLREQSEVRELQYAPA